VTANFVEFTPASRGSRAGTDMESSCPRARQIFRRSFVSAIFTFWLERVTRYDEFYPLSRSIPAMPAFFKKGVASYDLSLEEQQ